MCILGGMSELARSQGSWTSPKKSLTLALDNCQHISRSRNSGARRAKQPGTIKAKTQAAEGNWSLGPSLFSELKPENAGRHAIDMNVLWT